MLFIEEHFEITAVQSFLSKYKTLSYLMTHDYH